MTATSWVQIIKASLLLFGTGLLAVLVLMKFDFSLMKTFDTIAMDHGEEFLVLGIKYTSTTDSV
ncbi:sodium:solute symporter family transporter, partial [Lysinibacillus fusiformis]|uniref:sodium:solute symporter family transporter n=1 Tax=Lysinibacillus fusiformis TaxID=28031 RepID=UPI003B97C556